MKVKEAQQERNRLDAMELYDGAAVEIGSIGDQQTRYINVLNTALQRKYPKWRIEHDAVCGLTLRGESSSHALSAQSVLQTSPGRALEYCERLIKHGVDGDDS